MESQLSGFAKEAICRIYQQRTEAIPYVPVTSGPKFKPGCIRHSTASQLVQLGLGDWVGSAEQHFKLTTTGREVAERLLEHQPA